MKNGLEIGGFISFLWFGFSAIIAQTVIGPLSDGNTLYPGVKYR